jgi:hypothetical protein
VRPRRRGLSTARKKSKAKKELATNYTIRIVYFGENSTKVKESVDRNT